VCVCVCVLETTERPNDCTAHYLCSITVLHTHRCTHYCSSPHCCTQHDTHHCTHHHSPNHCPHHCTHHCTHHSVAYILSSASGHYSSFCSSLQHCTHQCSTNPHTDHTHTHAVHFALTVFRWDSEQRQWICIMISSQIIMISSFIIIMISLQHHHCTHHCTYSSLYLLITHCTIIITVRSSSEYDQDSTTTTVRSAQYDQHSTISTVRSSQCDQYTDQDTDQHMCQFVVRGRSSYFVLTHVLPNCAH
jgi:hypothetical protein